MVCGTEKGKDFMGKKERWPRMERTAHSGEYQDGANDQKEGALWGYLGASLRKNVCERRESISRLPDLAV